MFEGDDSDVRFKRERAKRDPSRSPNEKYDLKKQIQTKEKQKLVKLESAIARKQLVEKQKKGKEETAKKGIITIDQKEAAQKFIDDEQRKADVDKAQGQTEKPTQTV